MSDINQVSIVGNLTRDPKLIRKDNGKHVAFLSVALNGPNRADGSKGDATFVDVTVFGQMAENVTNSLHQGDSVMVTGRLGNGKEENVTQNGKTFDMTTLNVVANRVGPNLSFASAQVAKNERPQGQGGFQQQGQQGFGQGQQGFGQGQQGFGQGQQVFGQGQQGQMAGAGFGQGQQGFGNF